MWPSTAAICVCDMSMVAVVLVAKYVWTVFTTFPATHLSGRGETVMEEEETVPDQLGSNPPDTDHEDVPDTSKPGYSSASSQMNTAGVSTASQGTDNIHTVDVC